MRIVSPAKINLHLRVGPLAADGFHPILSWMCAIGLYDVIEMHSRAEPGISLQCDRPDVPVDETNLIVRAARALDKTRGANVTLHKKIPMGGGLGGGSSNAAFALVAFNKLWNLNLPAAKLAPIAATLGSDVPFFLHGSSSVCAGRGEKIKPIPPPLPRFAVLILPPFGVSTPAVYRRFDEMNLGSPAAIQDNIDWPAWTQLPAQDLMQVLVNDLEPPAFSVSPHLKSLHADLQQKVKRTIRMSGSGSTLFTLTDTKEEAQQITHQTQQSAIPAQYVPLSHPSAQ